MPARVEQIPHAGNQIAAWSCLSLVTSGSWHKHDGESIDHRHVDKRSNAVSQNVDLEVKSSRRTNYGNRKQSYPDVTAELVRSKIGVLKGLVQDNQI
jgi:hypothetical protein